jgi:hypothetical protein
MRRQGSGHGRNGAPHPLRARHRGRLADAAQQHPWVVVGLALAELAANQRITAGCLVVAALVYAFGRRSASRLSAPDALAHLAVLEKPEAPEPADSPFAQA